MKLSFIKLDIDIMNDTKIKIIRKMPAGNEILVVWIGILCLAMKSGTAGKLEIGDGIPFTDETLSAELDIELNTMRLALKTLDHYRMIETFVDGSMYITNFEKHQKLDIINHNKEKARLRVAKHRENIKQLACNGYNDVTQGVTCDDVTPTERDKDKDKERDKERDKDKDSEIPNKCNQPKKKTTNFIKPTIDKLTKYCTSKSYVIDCEHFYDYYESKGWLVGKTKMKSWQSALNNWHRNQKKFDTKSNTTNEIYESGERCERHKRMEKERRDNYVPMKF